LILEALRELSDGFDVVIVAHPAAVAFDIADRVKTLADQLGIPAELADTNELARHGDSPVIVTRPFGWTPEWGPKWWAKPKVLVDHSARFERSGEWAMTKREREVFA
jgi:hypothetical protein